MFLSLNYTDEYFFSHSLSPPPPPQFCFALQPMPPVSSSTPLGPQIRVERQRKMLMDQREEASAIAEVGCVRWLGELRRLQTIDAFPILKSDSEGMQIKAIVRIVSQPTTCYFVAVAYASNSHNFRLHCVVMFQHGIIARGLSTHKIPHLTKPTSKTTCTNRNGPKAIQDQVLVKVSESYTT
ncbi:hypothetical protein LXL04_038185 [Taraxacum kok-saghyz]